MKSSGTTTCALAILMVLAALAGCGAEEEPPYAAGFTILELERAPDDGDSYTIPVAVWYPTTERERFHRYGARPIPGRCAEDAPIATEGGPWPLVIFSHGYGGSGIAAPYLTEHLARYGYVVAAPDHSDPHQANRIRPPLHPALDLRDYLAAAIALANSGANFDFEAYEYRMHEARFVIDQMLACTADPEAFLHGAIDVEHVGMCGHSFGSYTTLACSGAGDRWRDDRLGAAISISGGTFMWSDEDYRTIAVPIMLMWGALEGRERGIAADRIGAQWRAWENCAPPKIMFVLDQATHFTFAQGNLDRVLGHRVSPQVLRRQHDAIATYCAAMFDRYLKGDLAAEATLTTRHPMFTDHRYVLE